MIPITRYAARPTSPHIHNGQLKRSAIVDTFTGKVVDRLTVLRTAERVAQTMNANMLRYPHLYEARS